MSSDTGEQMRAAFLAALMVLSVMAISGAASAAGTTAVSQVLNWVKTWPLLVS